MTSDSLRLEAATHPLVEAAVALALGPMSDEELARLLAAVSVSRFAPGARISLEATPELRLVVVGIVATHDSVGNVSKRYHAGQLLPPDSSEALASPYRALRDVLIAHVPSEALAGWSADRLLNALARTPSRAGGKPSLLIGVSGPDPRLASEFHSALAHALTSLGSVGVAVVERTRGSLPSRLALSALVEPADFQVVLFPAPASSSDVPPVDRWLYVVDGQRPGEGYPMPRKATSVYPTVVRLGTGVPRIVPQDARAVSIPGEAGLAPRTLVVSHESSRRLPHGTPRHLAFHQPDDHRHVRRGHAADHARLARELAGVPVGFTLGAGGARGLAHLGVLHAAEEAGVPVDYISGTSIGAVIGALVGMGHDANARREAAERLANARPFWDFALPTTALLSGRRFEALADEFFGGGVDLTDLWIPMVTMTCELGDFHETVHRRGSLRDILLAGIVLPGVLPPRILDGKLHVDGGTSDMLPVALLRAHSPGPIVAVDVSPWDGVMVPSERYPVGVRALLARLRGKASPLGAHQVFWRAVSYFVAARARVEGSCADLLIAPDVGAVGTSDLDELREIEAAGYVAGRAAFATEAGRRLRAREAPSESAHEQTA